MQRREVSMLVLSVLITAVMGTDVREIVSTAWSGGSLPETMLLELPEGPLKLHREGNRIAEVEVVERGRLDQWRGRKRELFGVYSEQESEGSFSVAVAGGVTMYGSFKQQGNLYSIKPFPPSSKPHHSAPSLSNSSIFTKITILGSPHLLKRHTSNKPPVYSLPKLFLNPLIHSSSGYSKSSSTNHDDVVVDRLKASPRGKGEQGTSSQHFIMNEQQFQLLKQTYPVKSPQQLTVELYVVVDYSVYKHWLELHRTSDKAITDLRYYYAHIVNAMSKRYEALNLDGVRISVSIAGYYIATSRKDAPFTDNVKVRLNSTTVEVYRTLDLFFEWVRERVKQQPPSLPRFDAAMLFTRQTLGVQTNETKTVRTISGLADIGALCQVNSVSIVKDFGVHGTLDTATHELAHNLGANHDGSNNECLSSEQYIMALAPNPVPSHLYNNTFSFSNCSKNDFAKYIKKINKNGRNCMVDGWGSAEKHNVTSLLEHYPGQKYTLDQQCRLIFGKESFFCGGGSTRIRDLCMGMFCYRPSTKGCKTEVQLKAADGTSCDHKSWCQGGHCVSDEAAPEFDNTCPFGDFKDKVPLLKSGHITCRQIAQKGASLCYNKFYQHLCCATCAKLSTQKQGCEYGDRNTTKCSRVQPYECYNDAIREECCYSCEQKKLKKQLPDCDYGDRAEWCRNTSVFSRLNCYNQKDKHVCCQTCNEFEKGSEGCEYGDRGEGCGKEDCSKKSYWLYCCETCAKNINMSEFKQMYAEKLSAQLTQSTSMISQDHQCLQDKASWCADLESYQCYNANETCCKKCLKFYQPTQIGCEYGDSSSECKTNDCVGENYIQTCCSTCSSVFIYRSTTLLTTLPPTTLPTKPSTILITKPPHMLATTSKVSRNKVSTNKVSTNKVSINKVFKTTNIDFSTSTNGISHTTTKPEDLEINVSYPVECPKGDKATWCATITPSQCYKSEKTCCQSCSLYYNPSLQGCEYGDKASWCESHVKKYASKCSYTTSSVATTCCFSCLQHKPVVSQVPEEERKDTGRGLEWLCPAGDQASYCSSISQAHSCYAYRYICCAACTRFLDFTVPECPFGDKVNWCRPFKNDERSCNRREISHQCCKTCASFVYNGKVPKSRLCTDQATWCDTMVSSQCYHPTARSACCASCHRFAEENEGSDDCLYGDKLSWCEKRFCNTHAKKCCKTCAPPKIES